jgi:tRNA pseudouridine55 synthase
MDGVIVVDKPEAWTSHDVVGKMRRITATKRIGHLGTLDPLATGVLPLVVGRATRLSQFYVKSDKQYDAVIRFGYSTATYDREGAPASEKTSVELDPLHIAQILDEFRGPITQVPPAVSAKKIDGVPAYKLARKNVPIEMKPIAVEIYMLELVSCSTDTIRIRVHCSGGTYLRSLAHDIGQRLGCGAFVDQLRRTASGHFTIEQSRTIPQLEELSKDGRLEEALIPAVNLLPEMPNEVVDNVTLGQIRQGRDFRVSPFRVRRGAKYVKAISSDGQLVAIGEVKLPNLYHPVLVL